MNATSVKKRRWSIPSMSNTHTWDKGFPVRSPTSLSRTLFKKPFVSIRPFMYISAFPSCTSFTAVRAAWVVSSTLMISKPLRSMSMEDAISLIFASSPTNMASAIFLSFAAFTASRTAESWATATATFLVPHSLTLAIKSANVLLICLLISARLLPI